MSVDSLQNETHFNYFLKDPIKIDKIINALQDMKNDIFKQDLSRINNLLSGQIIHNKIQDFSQK
jgi:hypothetical protein